MDTNIKKANLSRSLNGFLRRAIEARDARRIEDLLEKGADPNTATKDGETALSIALARWAKFLETAKWKRLFLSTLAREGVDVKNPRGSLLVVRASADGLSEAVEALLATGADPNASNPIGDGALHWAAKNGHVRTVEVLIAGGADPLAVGSSSGLVPSDLCDKTERGRRIKRILHQAALAKMKRDILPSESVDAHGPFLAGTSSAKGQIANRSDAQQRLRKAITAGNADGVRSAIADGADPNEIVLNFPLLFLAADFGGSPEVIKILLEAGADSEARATNGETALHVASKNGDGVECARALIVHGAALEARDSSGKTPLHYAAVSGNAAGVAVLLEFKADVFAKDEKEKTPLDLATNENVVVELKREITAKMSKFGLPNE